MSGPPSLGRGRGPWRPSTFLNSSPRATEIAPPRHLAHLVTAISLVAATGLYVSEDYRPQRVNDVNAFRTTYQTVGQPASLLNWKTTRQAVESETYEVRTPTPTVHAFRTTYQTVGQPSALVGWRSKNWDVASESYDVRSPVPDVHAFRGQKTFGVGSIGVQSLTLVSEDPVYQRADHNRLHSYRTIYQTVGQPWQALYQKPSVRVEAETYQPTTPIAFPRQIVSATVTTGQPFAVLWPQPSYRVEAEQYVVKSAGDLNLFRTTYQTVGQPASLLNWKTTRQAVEAETYEVRTPVPTVHAFRTTYQTVGQPLSSLISWKSKNWDVTAEAYEVRTPVPDIHAFRGQKTYGVGSIGVQSLTLVSEDPVYQRADHNRLHSFRTTYQTVGQPWQALYQRPSPRVEAETYQPATPAPFPRQIVSATVTTGQPFAVLWPQPSYRVEAEQYVVKSAGDLNLFRTTYQTVGQPRFALTPPTPTKVEAETYEVRKTPYFYQAANVTASPGQPFSLLWLKTGQPPPVDTFMGVLSTSTVAEQHSVQPTVPPQPYSLLSWKSKNWDVAAEVDFRVQDQNRLHAFRWNFTANLEGFGTELVTLSEDFWYPLQVKSQDFGLLPFRQISTGPPPSPQPYSLLSWASTRQQQGAEEYTVKTPAPDVHAFRTGFQTVGQPYSLLSWKSKNWDVAAEEFRPQPPADIGPFRWPTIIVIGAPYNLLSWTSTRQQMDAEQDFRVPQYSVHDYRPHQGQDPTVYVPPQQNSVGGGAGWKRKHNDEPDLRDKALADDIRGIYRRLTGQPDTAIARKAAEVVQPIAKANARVVPTVPQVDFTQVTLEIETALRLLEQIKQEDADDAEFQELWEILQLLS